MALDTDANTATQELKTLIQTINRGAGIIVIYDMGSIKAIIDSILDEINIKIRYFQIPITLMGIDIARKCSTDHDIDSIYHTISLEYGQYMKQNQSKNSVIITLCHTGEGGAVQLKNYIDMYSHLGMKTVALSISDRDELLKEVSQMKKFYSIHAFVGTYDPMLLGVPFIPISYIFEHDSDQLDRILMFQPLQDTQIHYDEIYKNLETQLKFTSITKLKTVLPMVIDELSVVYILNKDQTIGLFVHIANMIERQLSGERLSSYNPIIDHMMTTYKDDYRMVLKIMKRIEKAFGIIIDDLEIAQIICTIKQI